MTGAPYAVEGATEIWPSIWTTHARPAPAPTDVLQVICVGECDEERGHRGRVGINMEKDSV
jgi:CO dehydrogenase/acetyl-CoA synthase alpha subunit